jgi:hypothetical protein
MYAFGNETTIPGLHCAFPDETIAFLTALGFRLTYEMRRPYLYLAFAWHGVELHYAAAPKDLDVDAEDTGGCLVLVDEAAPYHEAFASAMRKAYGKVLVTGRPRMTRFRTGQSRFSLIDPSGNTFIFVERDEPEDLEYGGAAHLEGLERVLDNARILRDFKTDYAGAARVIDTGLRRHPDAPAVIRFRAFAMRAELAMFIEDADGARQALAELQTIELAPAERQALIEDLAREVDVVRWLEEKGRG